MQLTEKHLQGFIRKCKEKNLKLTPQRIAIFKTVITNDNHPTADDVFQIIKKEYPTISFDTVNRTLLKLKELKFLDIVDLPGAPRHFETNNDNHHHFLCENCGEIFDLYSEKFDEIKIPENIQNQFQIKSKKVLLKGFCNKCCKNKKQN